MSDEISIIVVDDHPLFRQGVVDVLSQEPQFKIIGQAQNGIDALNIIKSLHPAVAVVDINLPGLTGHQVVHQVLQDKLPTRIVLLTAYDDQEQVMKSAQAGASAYCAKDIEPHKLVHIIKEVALGNFVFEDIVMNPREYDAWLNTLNNKENGIKKGKESEIIIPLTNREMVILSFVVEGNSNKEIAAKLGISHQTVKNHVTSILHKFGVGDRTQAAVLALKQGWFPLNN